MKTSFDDVRLPIGYPVIAVNIDSACILKPGGGMDDVQANPHHLIDIAGGVSDALAETLPDALNVHRLDWAVNGEKVPFFFIIANQDLTEGETESLGELLNYLLAETNAEQDPLDKPHQFALDEIISEEGIEAAQNESCAYFKLVMPCNFDKELYAPSLQPKTVEEFVELILEQKDLRTPDNKPASQDTIATFMSHMHNMTYTEQRWIEEIYPLYLRRFNQ